MSRKTCRTKWCTNPSEPGENRCVACLPDPSRRNVSMLRDLDPDYDRSSWCDEEPTPDHLDRCVYRLHTRLLPPETRKDRDDA